MALVCFDTQLLIWGVQEVSTVGQEEQIRKTKSLIDYLSENSIPVIIPALVLAEFLVGIPVELHQTVSNLVQRGFMVIPFDAQAAVVSARIIKDKTDDGTVAEIVRAGNTRGKIKADCEIVAIAVSKGSDCIYSNDPHIRRLAEGHISVREVPEILRQGDLFPGIE